MSLIIGPFSLKDVARIASVPREIPLPGEKVQRATGIWLQHLSSGRFLRSPLITSNLCDSLDPTTFRGVHHILGQTILRRKALEPVGAL
jgi:hypothetical protein